MKPTLNFGDITEARERANKRYVSLATASHDASVLAEAVEGLLRDKGELVAKLRAEEGAFTVYRQAATSALGIDPLSCAEDVQEAIRELKLTLAANGASETP